MTDQILTKEEQETKEYLEKCFNKETGKYDIVCKCGKTRSLNHKQIWVFNMHSIKCAICDQIITKPYNKEITI